MSSQVIIALCVAILTMAVATFTLVLRRRRDAQGTPTWSLPRWATAVLIAVGILLFGVIIVALVIIVR